MDKAKKKRLFRVGAVLLALFAALLLVLFLHPPCLILQYTGFYCAGCGGQRMIFALLRGDLAGAFRHNPFLFCLLPLAAGYGVIEAARYIKEKRPLYKDRRFIWILLAVLAAALLFTVLRNLPGFACLGPG